MLHGGTIAEQPTCDAVAKHVRIGSMPPTSSKGGDHRMLRNSFLDGNVVRRDMAHEDRATLGLGPFVTQIICNRGAGGGRQWKTIGEMRLGSGNANDPVPPVDILDPQFDDFRAPEPKIRDAPHHGVSASSGRQPIVE
ncbi:hypothetical protein GCM10011497_19910 [Elstera cyanobacteriorum]|nr:hypothetical protein GCM10011497_19910 [Elstera cyanobacteriorum]